MCLHAYMHAYAHTLSLEHRPLDNGQKGVQQCMVKKKAAMCLGCWPHILLAVVADIRAFQNCSGPDQNLRRGRSWALGSVPSWIALLRRKVLGSLKVRLRLESQASTRDGKVDRLAGGRSLLGLDWTYGNQAEGLVTLCSFGVNVLQEWRNPSSALLLGTSNKGW